jgi:L-threonylcarbamoyladenylate synthase
VRRRAVGTETWAISPSAPDERLLREAAAVLADGGLVAFPTETFYGLGACALCPAAVRRVFAAKGRPETKPVLLLVDSVEMVERLAAEIPAAARTLMHRYWPGPLTLVLPARDVVPVELTAGSGTVGVRLSPHALATGLVRALGQPITAPSANPSGAPPPVTARDVLDGLAGVVDLVLDAGSTAGGPPSTVLDVTVEPPRVIRRGPITP